MNVIFLVPSLIKAGPINVVYDIIRHIDRDRFCPIVFSLMSPSSHRDVTDAFKKLGIVVKTFAYTHWNLELRTNVVSRAIQQELEPYPGCIVHGHGYHPTLIMAELELSRSLVTIHNICKEDFLYQKGFFTGCYMSFRYMAALRKISVSIVISDYMADFYRRRLSGKDVRTIYNGIDTSVYNLDVDKIHVKKNSKSIKRCVVSGRFSKRKNHLSILRSLKKSRRNDFVLFFLGIGEFFERCRSEVSGDSRFQFEGYQMDILPYLQSADFYISASLSEGLPLGVLEAVSMGIPTMLSNIPPHLEILEATCQPTELSFNPSDEDEMLRVFESNLDVIFDRTGIASAARRCFSAKVMGEEYSHVYHQIMNNL